MKNLIYITLAFFFAAQVGCKKEIEEFTFKGQFINGTNMQPTRMNETMTLIAKDQNDKFLHEIGMFTTDANGKFEFKYKRQKGNSITLEDGFTGRVRNLPINQNFEKHPWYFSDKGKLNLEIDFTNISLSQNDTIFIGYMKLDNSGNAEIKGFPIDSIILNISLDLYPAEQNVLFGIGSQNIEINNGLISKYQQRHKVKVTGDPVIDIFKIKY